ncbi:hypothetical protein MLD38_013796 [Melastoma candidum]|uniref:Uncharacterized protein n=1 Tax=Melastoma candidum TaxID=119954 RepID=A0ACB9REX1_9MYRT|nr:hypothetical protein MLD38_013796 [Melastoma candidum]
MADPSDGASEVTHEFRFFRVHKDGSINLFLPPVPKIPPFTDPSTGVQSKDVDISSDPPVSARVFLPPNPAGRKLPLLLYIHGGGFSMDSAFSERYHAFVSAVAGEASCVAVSVEYGLFPARPIPACYEDSWEALQWVASHASGAGPDPWINDHADLTRIFIAGDSAGGNITHTLVTRVGSRGLPGGVRVEGAVLIHPYLGGVAEDDEMWMYMCPTNEGIDDPRMKERKEDLERLGCERVLVFVAEKDHLMPCGLRYHEELRKSGWKGKEAELVINRGQNHCFHLFEEKEESEELRKKVVGFIKGGVN